MVVLHGDQRGGDDAAGYYSELANCDHELLAVHHGPLEGWNNLSNRCDRSVEWGEYSARHRDVPGPG